MTVVLDLALVGLALAATLCLVRLLRPGTLADRIVALDTLLVVLVGSVAVLGARTSVVAFIPVSLIVTLLAFVGTVTVAKFIERKGA